MGESAIVVERRGELRLDSGSYIRRAQELGLVFHSRTSLAEHSVFDLEEGEGKEERKKNSPLPRGSPLKSHREKKQEAGVYCPAFCSIAGGLNTYF
jgi:hypothetical protein